MWWSCSEFNQHHCWQAGKQNKNRQQQQQTSDITQPLFLLCTLTYTPLTFTTVSSPQCHWYKSCWGQYFRSLSSTIHTQSCFHPRLLWDFGGRQTIKQQTLQYCLQDKNTMHWFPSYKQTHTHTHTHRVAAAVCVGSECKTSWGGEDLLKWRSSIAPPLLGFPNKPHLAAAACSSQITHNGRVRSNICLPHTSRSSLISTLCRLTYSRQSVINCLVLILFASPHQFH